MSSHPLNLTVRFLLELSALFVLGMWGWQLREDGLRFVLAIGIPLLLAVLWGVFAVPNDPSRSGKAPVPVPGWLRLLLELAFFGLAVGALADLGYSIAAWLLGLLVFVHYLVSYDRIRWLLSPGQ